MIGIELVEEDGRTPSALSAAACLEACKAGGVLIGKGGLYGNAACASHRRFRSRSKRPRKSAAVIADALRGFPAKQGDRP